MGVEPMTFRKPGDCSKHGATQDLTRLMNFSKTNYSFHLIFSYLNFYISYGMPGVVEYIDSCHFRIFKPKEEEHLFYYGKHKKGSLNIQIVRNLLQYIENNVVLETCCRILSMSAKFGGATYSFPQNISPLIVKNLQELSEALCFTMFKHKGFTSLCIRCRNFSTAVMCWNTWRQWRNLKY
ncbi:unnamed protein product [Diatraea saccharalis]|uniref:Uncharacterized protein n=1 Tax=Diatraea saccharalis TaxID=40085 RepID=A0A9N9N3Y4_9NEOP|nr:unnamed protein product [Diatraea saccharalis]